MKIISITPVEFFYLDEIADLIAYARNPQVDNDPDYLPYQLSLVTATEEVNKAAIGGALNLSHPQTHGPFPMELGIKYAVALPHDVTVFLAGYGISLVIEAPEQSPAPPAPVVPDEVDLTMVATRTELIDAFGKFTDMDKSWFDNLTDAPKLMAARKYTGQGGRHSAEPLFCPYLVMQWMADPKRKKGRRLNDTTAWRLLKSHFPKVYNQYSIGDPNTD